MRIDRDRERQNEQEGDTEIMKEGNRERGDKETYGERLEKRVGMPHTSHQTCYPHRISLQHTEYRW